MRMLVIEDDAEMRVVVREMLEELGCSVIEAEDGEKAVSHFAEARFDAVLTDILMPNKEGIETIRALKRARPDVPIVAMSGGGIRRNMTFLEIARHIGAFRALSKPIDFSALVEVVDALRGR